MIILSERTLLTTKSKVVPFAPYILCSNSTFFFHVIYCYLELLCSLTHLLVYFCLLLWNMSQTSASFNILFPIPSVALYIVFLNSYFTVFLAIKRVLQYLASTSVNCYRSAISINIRNVRAF